MLEINNYKLNPPIRVVAVGSPVATMDVTIVEHSLNLHGIEEWYDGYNRWFQFPTHVYCYFSDASIDFENEARKRLFLIDVALAVRAMKEEE